MSIAFSPAVASPQLRLETSDPASGTTTIAVIGEVDLYTAAVLLGGILRVLRMQTAAVLEIDLGRVTFLDCNGADALVVARDAARQAGVRMRVTRPQSIVRRVLDLVGLLGVLADPADLP
jgi:anti-sigma B factor antagonist